MNRDTRGLTVLNLDALFLDDDFDLVGCQTIDYLLSCRVLSRGYRETVSTSSENLCCCLRLTTFLQKEELMARRKTKSCQQLKQQKTRAFALGKPLPILLDQYHLMTVIRLGFEGYQIKTTRRRFEPGF